MKLEYGDEADTYSADLQKIIGAAYFGEQDAFVSITSQDLLENKDKFSTPVLAETKDDIQKLLHRMHPCPDGFTRIRKVGQVFAKSQSQEKRILRTQWEVVEPYLPFNSAGLEKVLSMCVAQGQVRTDEYFYCRAEKLTERGIVIKRLGYYTLLTYNPDAIARRPHSKAMREYKKSLKTKFPASVWHGMYSAICSEKWPEEFRYGSTLQSIPSSFVSGNSLSVYKYQFNCIHFTRMMEVNKKLGLGKFWQLPDNSTYNSEFYIRLVISDAWINILAVEAHNRSIVKSGNPDSFEWAEAKNILAACRWLRAEAKRLGVDRPKKMKKPLTLRQQETRKTKRRSRRKTKPTPSSE